MSAFVFPTLANLATAPSIVIPTNVYLQNVDGLATATSDFIINSPTNFVLTQGFVRITAITGVVMMEGSIRLYKKIGPTETNIVGTTTLTGLTDTSKFYLFNFTTGLNPVVLIGEDLKCDVVGYTGAMSINLHIALSGTTYTF